MDGPAGHLVWPSFTECSPQVVLAHPPHRLSRFWAHSLMLFSRRIWTFQRAREENIEKPPHSICRRVRRLRTINHEIFIISAILHTENTVCIPFDSRRLGFVRINSVSFFKKKKFAFQETGYRKSPRSVFLRARGSRTAIKLFQEFLQLGSHFVPTLVDRFLRYAKHLSVLSFG